MAISRAEMEGRTLQIEGPEKIHRELGAERELHHGSQVGMFRRPSLVI